MLTKIGWFPVSVAGLDVGNQATPRNQQPVNAESFQQHNSSDLHSQNHWGENRLADVVKGTAKLKNNNREIGHENESPRATSPQQAPHLFGGKQHAAGPQQDFAESKDAATGSEDVHASTVTLTPPSSPEKLVGCFLVFERHRST